MSDFERSLTGIEHHPEGCVVSLVVAPRSAANRIEIGQDGRIRIRLTAPPVEGAANAGLLKLLAKTLGVPQRSLKLLAGERARQKRVLVEGATLEATTAALLRAARGDRR